MGVFIDRNDQGYSFHPPNKYKPTKQAVWCTRNQSKIMWNSGRLEHSEIPNILPSDVEGEYFAKVTEKCKFLGNLMGKEVENLIDHCSPKIQDVFDEDIQVCSSCPFKQKNTLH